MDINHVADVSSLPQAFRNSQWPQVCTCQMSRVLHLLSPALISNLISCCARGTPVPPYSPTSTPTTFAPAPRSHHYFPNIPHAPWLLVFTHFLPLSGSLFYNTAPYSYWNPIILQSQSQRPPSCQRLPIPNEYPLLLFPLGTWDSTPALPTAICLI